MSNSDEATWSQATLDARKHAAHNVVFLIPGLLGFESFTTFSYFEDRVAAALRAALEQAWQEPTAIVPVPIPPTASLRVRQRMLMETMADRLQVLERNH